MNMKIILLPIMVISGLLGAAMIAGGDMLMGIIFIAIAITPLILMKILGKPQPEKELYTKINEALESVPDTTNYGKLILTGIKPAKYLYEKQEHEEEETEEVEISENGEIKTKKIKKKQNPQLQEFKDHRRQITHPAQTIQPAKEVGQIIKKVSIETKHEDEERVLHVFKIHKKIGLIRSKTFWLYVYHDELINPIMEEQNVVVEGIDIFPITDKHYITSTSPGRKIMEFVEGLGILGSAETLLDHLGRITKETLKSNMEHQRRMQLGGQVLKIGKKGLQTAKKGYGTIKQSAEGAQRDRPIDEQLR